MQYQYYDLGNLSAGQVVEVTLGYAANVRVMDSSNYSSFKAGRRHSFIGGYVKRSPYKAAVPHSGHWYVVVDLGGYSGKVKSAVRVLSGILPTAKQQALSTVPSLFLGREDAYDADSKREYDVFISHASEDKDAVVRPLANTLRDKGLRVWYDEFELKIGDSLRRKIDIGLEKSNFGIVVISRSFIRKGWTNYELDGLITRAVSGEQVLLPIWHDITKQEVIDYSPSLADKVARNTAINTIDEIATERELTLSTVQQHIMRCAEEGMDVDLNDIISSKYEQLILDVIKRLNTDRLRPIKDELPDEVDYLMIKAVIFKHKKDISSI
jgi:hypothetical protein